MMFDNASGGGAGHRMVPGHMADHPAYGRPLQTAFRFADA
jgi:hypothetical protein